MQKALASQSGATSQIPVGKRNPTSVLHEVIQCKNIAIDWKILHEDKKYKAWPVLDGVEYPSGYAINKPDAKKNSSYLTLKLLTEQNKIPMIILERAERPSLPKEKESTLEYGKKEIHDEEMARKREGIDEQVMRPRLPQINPISKLNEVCLKNSLKSEFQVTCEGPENDKIFKMDFMIGNEVIAKSQGKSKKDAKFSLCMTALTELLKRSLISEDELGIYTESHDSKVVNNSSEMNSLSKLNEVCSKNALNPVFQVTMEGSDTDRIFKMVLLIGDEVIAKSHGQSKKDVKLSVCRRAINELSKRSLISEDKVGTDKVSHDSKIVNNKPVSVTEINPMSKFNEICAKYRLSPDFHVTSEGPDNDIIFKIDLLIGDEIIASSYGKSKKDAKYMVCIRAIHELKRRGLISEDGAGAPRGSHESRSSNIKSSLRNAVSALNEYSQKSQQKLSYVEYSKTVTQCTWFYTQVVLDARQFDIKSSINKKKAKTRAAYAALRTLAKENIYSQFDRIQVPEDLLQQEVEYMNHTDDELLEHEKSNNI